MDDRQHPGGSDDYGHEEGEPNRETLGRFYTQDEINEIVSRSITVNVNQQQPLLDPDDYPGLGAGSHILHLLLSLLTSGLWIPVWIIIAIRSRVKWDKKIRNQQQSQGSQK